MSESPDNLIANLVQQGVAVAFYLSDGTTARQRYPWDSGKDLAEAVELTISVAKRTGKGIQVESMDDGGGDGNLRFIAPAHIVAWVIEPGFDLTAAGA
jgi:hypothetical protein